MKDQVVELIGGAVSQLLTDGVLTEGDIPTPQVDHTRDPSHGDLATNIAMVLAKRAGMAPRDLAAAIGPDRGCPMAVLAPPATHEDSTVRRRIQE